MPSCMWDLELFNGVWVHGSCKKQRCLIQPGFANGQNTSGSVFSDLLNFLFY